MTPNMFSQWMFWLMVYDIVSFCFINVYCYLGPHVTHITHFGERPPI